MSVYYDKQLIGISVAYMRQADNFIADRVFPTIPYGYENKISPKPTEASRKITKRHTHRDRSEVLQNIHRQQKWGVKCHSKNNP